MFLLWVVIIVIFNYSYLLKVKRGLSLLLFYRDYCSVRTILFINVKATTNPTLTNTFLARISAWNSNGIEGCQIGQGWGVCARRLRQYRPDRRANRTCLLSYGGF